MPSVDFGWHAPSFPTDGSDANTFLGQMHTHLQLMDGHLTSVWVDDHVHPWGMFVPRETPATEVMTTLAYFAGLYPNYDWGSLVLCQSYRNPALTAKMAASLQWLTGGRYIFGIGAGWLEEEYEAYNWPFPRPAARIRQLEETIEIVKLLWTESPASYEGRYYRIENAYCQPQPRPLPPVMVGGGGEQLTLRVVAKHADWWNMPGGTSETYAHKLRVLREHCEAVGRDFHEIRKTSALPPIAVHHSEAVARQQGKASPYALGGRGALTGTPDQVAAQLQEYIDAGVTLFQIRIADFPETAGTELFIQEVLPRFKD